MTSKTIQISVSPGSRTESVEALADGSLKVRVRQVAEKGKATARVLELLAQHFAVPKSRVELLSGATSRRKLVKLHLEA